MKKIYYLLMLVSIALNVSCSESGPTGDENGNETGNGNGNSETVITTDAIIGTWKCVAYEGYDSDREWNETYDSPDDFWGFKFNADNTALDYECLNGEMDAVWVEWTLSDNKLTITFQDGDYYEEDEYEVEKLTSSELIIAEYWESEDGSNKEMGKYTYKKIADFEYDNNNNKGDGDGGGDDDDDNDKDIIKTNDIIGTWKCIHEFIKGEGEFDINEGEDSWGWTYTADGIAYDFDFYEGIYDFDDDNTTTYKVEGDKIIHKYSDGETFTCTIKSFDGDIIVLGFEGGDSATLKKQPNIILPN